MNVTPFLLNVLLQVDPNRFNDYLALGYFAMWLTGLLYVISLIVRQRNLHQDIALMKRLLEEDEDK